MYICICIYAYIYIYIYIWPRSADRRRGGCGAARAAEGRRGPDVTGVRRRRRRPRARKAARGRRGAEANGVDCLLLLRLALISL